MLAFAEEAATLKPQEREKISRILKGWETENTAAVKNLLAEHFLAHPEMQYIVRKFVELPEDCSCTTLEGEFRQQFYSWLQLQGTEIEQYAAAPERIGIVIPLDLIQNLFLTQYSTWFPTAVRFDRFIDNLEQHPKPGEWLQGRRFGYLRVKADYMLNWFFWDSEGEIGDPRELLHSMSSLEAREFLDLPSWHEAGNRLAVMVFRYHPAAEGMQLFRPTWCDADFMAGFQPPPSTETRFGIVNPTYQRPIKGRKRIIAEAVGRSAYFKLSFLESFEIFS